MKLKHTHTLNTIHINVIPVLRKTKQTKQNKREIGMRFRADDWLVENDTHEHTQMNTFKNNNYEYAHTTNLNNN